MDRPQTGPSGADDLTAALTELGSLMLATSTVTELLEEIARLAAAAVTPRASCGLTLRQDHAAMTVANSDGRAARLDEVQYGSGDGPCMEALRTGDIVVVPDFTTERRWPPYPSHALGYGISSSLSLPLTVDGEVRGALNLYAPAKNAFGVEQRAKAAAFATQASTVLTVVLRQTQHAQLTDQLREALATRSGIDQALGILMAQQGCDRDAAFGILRSTSQNQNRKLRDVAADIVEAITGQPPEATPFNEPA